MKVCVFGTYFSGYFFYSAWIVRRLLRMHINLHDETTFLSLSLYELKVKEQYIIRFQVYNHIVLLMILSFSFPNVSVICCALLFKNE